MTDEAGFAYEEAERASNHIHVTDVNRNMLTV